MIKKYSSLLLTKEITSVLLIIKFIMYNITTPLIDVTILLLKTIDLQSLKCTSEPIIIPVELATIKGVDKDNKVYAIEDSTEKATNAFIQYRENRRKLYLNFILCNKSWDNAYAHIMLIMT